MHTARWPAMTFPFRRPCRVRGSKLCADVRESCPRTGSCRAGCGLGSPSALAEALARRQRSIARVLSHRGPGFWRCTSQAAPISGAAATSPRSELSLLAKRISCSVDGVQHHAARSRAPACRKEPVLYPLASCPPRSLTGDGGALFGGTPHPSVIQAPSRHAHDGTRVPSRWDGRSPRKPNRKRPRGQQ
ncbi:hypothetical protein FA09DRAFT_228478 [Tilletiopsis washingtonensis]|jgi:hypothetical protein|uniref:Uncharacterized protein n=1 Tax=Tilletiopsis washingtonensis TaxID=58919 RepID=A0A316ZCW3_9BASI|nr:hypothetical protein FA09DRAFT_228478 [Tilletiopsis washingtonensis]PWN99359.1 hypothetical protein FA09DRAFT_228478 [Tilletiopsis washingtonensis]